MIKITNIVLTIISCNSSLVLSITVHFAFILDKKIEQTFLVKLFSVISFENEIFEYLLYLKNLFC